jgi:hypothetical protein
MKRVFKNNRLLAIAFFTVFSVAAMPAVLANGGDKNKIPVELKLIGSVKNKPLFQLNFNGSPEDNEFIIIIRDDIGTSLYRENIKGEVFSKNFLVNTDEMGDASITFEIFSRKTNKNVVYEVRNNNHLVEETVISQVK